MRFDAAEPLVELPPVDVAVVGGGVVGVACAWALAGRGLTVAVLEKDRIGHGCSYGNAGWLTPSLSLPLAQPGMIWKSLTWLLDPESPLYIEPRLDPGLLRWLLGFLWASRSRAFWRGVPSMIELSIASVRAWEELAQRSGQSFGFERHGLLSVYETARAFERGKKMADRLAAYGIPSEIWTPDQVREREPAIVGKQVGACFFPQDGHCEPFAAVEALAAAARERGVLFYEGAELFAVDREASRVVRLRTTRGAIRLREVVLATGAESGAVGRLFGWKLPILGAKGYSLVIPRLRHHPGRSIYLTERKIAVNPHRDRLRLGGTLELVRSDLTIHRRRVRAILAGASALLDLPEPLVVHELWRGLRPCAPDGLPLIGRARGGSNVWLATGHQMAGLKTAPATGELLADLILGSKPAIDPMPFRADRY